MESWNRSEPWEMDHETLGNRAANPGRWVMELAKETMEPQELRQKSQS